MFVIICCMLAGCITTGEYEVVEVSTPSKSVAVEKRLSPKSGVYHKVSGGETLWRIAQTYQVSLEDILKINGIPKEAVLEENQLIFIPGASKVRDIIVTASKTNKDEFDWPLRGRIVRYFKSGKEGYLHRGIGIKAMDGQRVVAAKDGRIVFSDYLMGYGLMVVVDHVDGYHTIYARNSQLFVKPGEFVVKGQKVAEVGAMGRETFLYFEIRKKKLAVNPLFYLPKT